mmetsp:Transcript_6083/g.18018  ORF Transcript_6083/g.18018 Transcript_6083/m.18018 type:complete len:214 (-) Transcript_6083:851-1492(-)
MEFITVAEECPEKAATALLHLVAHLPQDVLVNLDSGQWGRTDVGQPPLAGIEASLDDELFRPNMLETRGRRLIGQQSFVARDVFGEPDGFVCANIFENAVPHELNWASHLTCQYAVGTYLFVKPNHRRQGLAKRLARCAEVYAAKQGAAKAIMIVAEDNMPARELYTQCGFTQTGTCVQGGGADAGHGALSPGLGSNPSRRLASQCVLARRGR